MMRELTCPYDAVLFDLDGTLTESEPGIVNSVKYSLDKIGFTAYDGHDLKKFIGPPLYEAYRDILKMDEETAREGVRIYRERFAEVGWAENSVYEGIPALIRSLKRCGVHVGLATAKPRLFAERILEHFGLLNAFDAVAAIDLKEMHADKEALVKSALPGEFRRAVMVGDRKYDMYGAKKNGIDGFGVLYGYGSREELESHGATRVFESVADLTRALVPEAALAPGLFITVEGSDGSGKSTQVEPLANFIRACGYEVVKTREPGGCPIAEQIRNLVLGEEGEGMTALCEAYLFAAARAQHISDVIRPALARGAVVLCDRFVDSSAAYQGAGRALGVEAVFDINRRAIDGCMPDLTLFFDINPDLALKRRTQDTALDRIEREGAAFSRRVYEGYKEILAGNFERIAIVDGSGSIDDVALRAREAVMRRLSL